MVLVTLSVVASVCVANLHHRTPDIHAMPRWLQKTFLETIPTVLLMQRPKVPHPIFPTGHRFSVSSEYPSNYKFVGVLSLSFLILNSSTYQERKNSEKPDDGKTVFTVDHIPILSGRLRSEEYIAKKLKPKKVKIAREDTIYGSFSSISSATSSFNERRISKLRL